MYYPYFRGKQFELITIRETATLLAEKGFVPLIEPVRESLGGLKRTLEAIREAQGKAIVIVNPQYGDHSDDGTDITALLEGGFIGTTGISAGILLRSNTSLSDAKAHFERHRDHHPTFVHAGFNEPRALAEYLGTGLKQSAHVFVSSPAAMLYRKHFTGSTRILIQDGFERRKNADYALNSPEKFSELHVTYRELVLSGFGDFLIVGDDYSESGGPAYAVAIHLTYIDPSDDNVMYVHHFVSTSNDTPTDPAGKFAQALEKLIDHLDSGRSNLLETKAIVAFRELHAEQHFPGLGNVKKLSMKHHIETLAAYLR